MGKILIPLLLLMSFDACAAAEENQVILEFIGFFNSESPEFNPSPIGYSAMVDIPQVFQESANAAATLGYKPVPYGDFQSSLVNLSDGQANSARIVFNTVIEEMNQILTMQHEICQECSSLKFFPLTEISNYRDWGNLDRIVLVFGLETLNPQGSGLISGIAAISFDAAGSFVGFALLPYNFTLYNTTQMASDSRELIRAVLSGTAL